MNRWKGSPQSTNQWKGSPQSTNRGRGLLGDEPVEGVCSVDEPVVKELHEVALEVLDLLGGDERVHHHLSVGSAVDTPLGTGDGGRVDSLTGARDRAGATNGSQPDHDLEFLLALSSRAREQIIGDIGHDFAAVLDLVRHGRRDGLDLRKRHRSSISIGLDLLVTALPRPGRLPSDSVTRAAVQAGTLLAAAGGCAGSPQVVVDNVVTRRGLAPLVAEFLGIGRRHGRSSQSSSE
ncbi:hypothetical protein GQ600_20963 [Phytophthora cactorum]|nr:hypothetical protein GQ600_20963 [Phytophthora cactorum]